MLQRTLIAPHSTPHSCGAGIVWECSDSACCLEQEERIQVNDVWDLFRQPIRLPQGVSSPSLLWFLLVPSLLHMIVSVSLHRFPCSQRTSGTPIGNRRHPPLLNQLL